jgi:hypothetical protein
MNEYFEICQQIKSQILQDNSIMSILIKYLNEGELPERIFPSGHVHAHYHIGRLESGLWIAARQNKDLIGRNDVVKLFRETGFFPHHIAGYERYAQKAEQLHGEGHRVTRFCIGAFGKKNIALLVEDFSAGGEYKLIHNPEEEIAGYLENDPDTVIYVDLDNYVTEYEIRKYFDQEVMIVV